MWDWGENLGVSWKGTDGHAEGAGPHSISAEAGVQYYGFLWNAAPVCRLATFAAKLRPCSIHTAWREHTEAVKEGLSKRRFQDLHLVDEAVSLDDRRKRAKHELDETQAEANGLSKRIGGLYKEGKRDEAEQLKARSGELKELIRQREADLELIEADLEHILLSLPNVPHDLVVEGRDETDNVEVRRWGSPAPLENGRAHWELAEQHDPLQSRGRRAPHRCRVSGVPRPGCSPAARAHPVLPRSGHPGPDTRR